MRSYRSHPARLLLPMVLALACPGIARAQEGDETAAEVSRARDLLNGVLPQGLSRDVRTQYMMIDQIQIVVPGRAPGGSGGFDEGGPGDEPAGGGGPSADGVFLASTAEGGRFILLAGPGAAAADDQEAIVGFLRSLGESTGPAFQFQVGGQNAFSLSADGLVVEPVVIRDQLLQSVQTQITSLAAQNPVTQVLNAYCLEFLKSPPSVDQIFRIADEQLQQLYRPAANILRAGRQLVENGVFSGEPLDYVYSIKQWALWAAEGDYSFESFSQRFLAHAQDNFAMAGKSWNEQIQLLVEGTLPERWDFIQQMLALADQMPGGAQWPFGN